MLHFLVTKRIGRKGDFEKPTDQQGVSGFCQAVNTSNKVCAISLSKNRLEY
jgi:hypothetical protein